MKLRERQIEAALVKLVKAAGGLAIKIISPNLAGLPDRLVLLPRGSIKFVELKAPGETPRPLQIKRHKQLAALGFTVLVIDSLESVQEELN